MNEVYKPIPGYESLYEISNHGNVRSLDRYNIDKNGKRKFYPGVQCKFDVSKSSMTSYHRVTLSKEGKTKRFLVHRLVALAFIPNTENKPHINHIDNDGTNNQVTNLEWCTHSENMLHSQKQGRQFANQSKAGTVAGTNKRNQVLDEINSNVGNTFGNFILLSYDTHRNGKHHIMCACLRCGSVTSMRYKEVVNGKVTRCYPCRNVKDENLHSFRDKI